MLQAQACERFAELCLLSDHDEVASDAVKQFRTFASDEGVEVRLTKDDEAREQVMRIMAARPVTHAALGDQEMSSSSSSRSRTPPLSSRGGAALEPAHDRPSAPPLHELPSDPPVFQCWGTETPGDHPTGGPSEAARKLRHDLAAAGLEEDEVFQIVFEELGEQALLGCDSEGYTPLQQAVRTGSQKILELILDVWPVRERKLSPEFVLDLLNWMDDSRVVENIFVDAPSFEVLPYCLRQREELRARRVEEPAPVASAGSASSAPSVGGTRTFDFGDWGHSLSG